MKWPSSRLAEPAAFQEHLGGLQELTEQIEPAYCELVAERKVSSP